MSANTERRRHSLANYEIDDPGPGGAIPNNQTGLVRIRTSAAESRSLENPAKAGLDLVLNMEVDGGDCTITVASAFKEDGATQIIFNDPGEFIALRSLCTGENTFGWRMVGGNSPQHYLGTAGVTLGSTVAITTDIGTLTTDSASAIAGAEHSFTATMASLTGSEIVTVSPKYNGSTGTPIVGVIDQASGSFTVGITNVHASEALNGTFNINYNIVRQD